MSGATAADARARERAQTDFDVPLLLEAGAGTGKTAVLVARIVAWCLGPGWERVAKRSSSDPSRHASRVLRGVVAITFTEAASAEMARRIAEGFEQVGRGVLPPGLYEAALPPPGLRERRAEAFRLALDQLRVHTIHAFCLRLLLSHPLEAGVHPRLQVDADGQAIAAAVREVLEEALPRAFGEEPDPRWLWLAEHDVGPREIEAALATLLGDGVVPEDLATTDAAQRRCGAFQALLQGALARFTDLERRRLEALGNRSPNVSLTARLLREAAPIVAAEGDPARLGRALLALPGWEQAQAKLADFARGKFGKNGCEALGEDAEALAALAAEIRPLLNHLRELDPDAHARARSVLHELVAAVHARLRRRGIASFGALLRGARDLLRDEGVRSAVRGELQQLLVDEFQDTDALQCEILEALALDEPERPHPVLFLVGDPKQSIYGWRNADLRAYQRLRDRIEAGAGSVVPLVVNFRSAPAILEEVTRLVEPVMEPVHGLQPAFEALAPSEQTRGQAGYTDGDRGPVEHWLPARLDPETAALDAGRGLEERALDEARAVAADVADLAARGVELDQIAVLHRVTAGFEPVLEALREQGIPYLVERESDFYQRREILDVVALVRCVLDSHDHLALVAALRSSAVGVPDAAWLPLWRENFPERVGAIDGTDTERLAVARAAARRAAGALPPDVPEAAALEGWPHALDDFLQALHELRGRYEREAPEAFTERLRERFALEASEASRHLGEHRVANLDRFFRDLVLALDQAAGSAASLVSFLRRAGSVAREHNEGRPRAPSGPAVQVLTIHRAKGLDWKHVYLLGVDRAHRATDPKGTSVVRRAGDLGFVLFGWPEPALPVLSAEREAVEAAERVRLLYVATTRAKERLVVGARIEKLRPWRQARTFAQLLAVRDVDWAAVARGEGGHDGTARFRVVAPEPRSGARRPRPSAEVADATRVARDEQGLRAARAAARVHAQRPFASTASAEAHTREQRAQQQAGETETSLAPAFPEPPASSVPRDVARAAGTALHAVLEAGRADVTEVALDRAVAAAAAPGQREAVLAHARTLWEGFAAGPLAGRLASLAPHVVARELPVWVEAEGDGEEDPVGFVAGAVDLLYRDPESGKLVVADYKTDAVAAERVDEHVERYRAQGAVYTRAVTRALALPEPPRFELWFLAAGVVRTLLP